MALKRKLSSGFSDGLISPNFKQIREQAEFDLAWYWLTKEKRTPTAACDKAGSPNDVCPHGQVMSASPNDVAFGNDVVPSAQWANITSLRPSGATSLRTK